MVGDMLDEAQADVYKEEWMSLKVRWIHFIRPSGISALRSRSGIPFNSSSVSSADDTCLRF